MADNSLDDLNREELVQRCLSAEENMKQAATYGQSLLLQLSQERAERNRLQNELTAHEQTNHELRCQLEVKAAMERNAREELEAMQRDLAEAVSDAEVAREEGRRLEAQLRAELHREMLKAEAAEAEAGHSRVQTDKTVAALRVEAEELRQQLECYGQNSADSLNVSKISGDLAEMRDEKTALEQELASSKALQRALQAEVKAARVELEEAAEVLRAREEKIACLKEQLEGLQAQNAVLSSELDVARAGGGSRGNSLFSELEDRRIRAERCLVEQQELNRALQERYLAKVRELREFREDVCTQMISLRHQRKDGRSTAEALCEAEQRCVQLEQELRERRAEEKRQANAREMEVLQQEELAAAFGVGGSSACDSIAEIYKKRAAALAKTLEERVAEVWKLRGNRREAINRVEQLRAELRESETARLRLSLQLEGLREEQNLQRKEKPNAPTSNKPVIASSDLRSPEPSKEEEAPLEQRLQQVVLQTVNLDLMNQPRSDSGDQVVRFEVPEGEKENEKQKEEKKEQKASKQPRKVREPPKVIRPKDEDGECKQM